MSVPIPWVGTLDDFSGYYKNLTKDFSFYIIKQWGTLSWQAVSRIRSRIRMFLGLLDPDPFVRCMDPDPSIIKQKS